MKIIFAGTPEFAVAPLCALLNEPELDVIAVYTQPDRRSGRGKKITPSPVKALAQKYDIPIYQPTSLKDEAAFIADLQADVMVVVAYGMLLTQKILDAPKLGCINIHASVLPRWRGAAPIHRAIEAGDKGTGVSIMKMELGLDTGPVYQVLKTSINTDDTTSSLHDRLAELGSQGIISTLKKLAIDPSLKSKVQDDSLANYAHKIKKEEAEIDWHLSADAIERRIRAFNPWPGCQSWHKSQSTDNQSNRIRFWSSSVITEKHESTPGTIINISNNGVQVACGSNQLLIKSLQKDGGKPLQSNQFLNGYSLEVGDQFVTKISSK